MIKPQLPASPSGLDWIKRISPDWIRRLISCVGWLMDRSVQPDGRSILRNEFGVITVNPEILRGGSVQTVSTGVGSSEYNGYFKVSAVSGGVVSVFNGADVSGGIAGYSDLGAVSGGTLTFATSGAVYLKGDYVSGGYTQTFVSSGLSIPVYGSGGYTKLADVHVSGGAVTSVAQVWTGGQIYWGERYII